MGKLNRSVVEAKEFIEQNKGSMTNKQMGEVLGGVTPARISQLRSIKSVLPSVNPESSASTAEA